MRVPRPADVLERDAGLRFAPVASDLQPAVTAAKTLRDRWRRLSRPAVALHADRPCFSLGTIGLADACAARLWASSARILAPAIRLPMITSRDLVLIVGHQSGPCEPAQRH